jgi:hypothetical protein
MKKVFVVSVKILLPILFLYNIGFFNLDFPKFFNEIGKTEPLNIEGQKKLAKFVNEKVKVAEKKGDKYSPHDYFSDLYEIEKMEKSMKGVMSYHVLANQLLILQQENMRKGLFSNYDITVARTKYQEKINPGSIARAELKRDMQEKTFWPNLRNWLWHFYLVNLPLAFLMFLVWWYQEKKNFKISNPLSFAIALIFYPIIIALVIREALSEKSRYFVAEAELRRTKKKMFSILSKNEIEDIRRFATSRGLTLNDWRNYLGNQGLKPQGILVSSLVVTILFTAIPRFSFSQDKAERAKTNLFTTMLTTQVNAPPSTTCLAHDEDNNQAPVSASGIIGYIFYEFNPKNLRPIILRVWTQKFHLQEVILKIEHVPCFCF